MRHYFLKCRTVLVHNGFAILCDYNQRRNQLKREVSDEANLFTVTQGVDICHCLEALLGPVLFTQLLVAPLIDIGLFTLVRSRCLAC